MQGIDRCNGRLATALMPRPLQYVVANIDPNPARDFHAVNFEIMHKDTIFDMTSYLAWMSTGCESTTLRGVVQSPLEDTPFTVSESSGN
jgi:hypothetical protein